MSGVRGAQRRACAALLAAAVVAAGWLAAAQARPAARAARVLYVKDEGRLHLAHSSGSQLIDEGRASGTLPGTARIVFVYDGAPTVEAQITIRGAGGAVRARGSGHLSSPTSPSPSFHGTLTIVGGTGRYAHAHGGGQLYGVFYRRSYAIVVQAQGTLDF